MDQQARSHSWEQELSEWKDAHHQSYQLSQANARLLKGIVDQLGKAGINIQPLIDQHREEIGKLITPPQKQK